MYSIIRDTGTPDTKRLQRFPIASLPADAAATLDEMKCTRAYPYATGVISEHGHLWQIEGGDPGALLHAMAARRVKTWQTPAAPGSEAGLLAATTSAGEPMWEPVLAQDAPVKGWHLAGWPPCGEPYVRMDPVTLETAVYIETNWGVAQARWLLSHIDPGGLSGDKTALRFGVWRNVNFTPRRPIFTGLAQYVLLVPAYAADNLGEPGGGYGGLTLQPIALYRQG